LLYPRLQIFIQLAPTLTVDEVMPY